MKTLNRQIAYVPMFVAELSAQLLWSLSDAQLSDAGIDVDLANEAADGLAECGFTYTGEDD